jgi:hypothetical protein
MQWLLCFFEYFIDLWNIPQNIIVLLFITENVVKHYFVFYILGTFWTPINFERSLCACLFESGEI